MIDLRLLYQAATKCRQVVRQGELAHRLGGISYPDLRGVFLWHENLFQTHPGYTTDWIAEATAFQFSEDWRRTIAPLCMEITRQFFSAWSDWPALVYVETCRDALAVQNVDLKRKPGGAIRDVPVDHNKLMTFSGQLTLPASRLPFAYRKGYSMKQCRIVQTEHLRILPGPDRTLTGMFRTFCFGDRHDDRDVFDRWAVPGSMDCQVAPGVSGGRMVNWLRFPDTVSDEVDSYTIEVHPEGDKLLSIRHAPVSLTIFTAMHARLLDWLREAVRA